MKYRNLGDTGLVVSEIGFGAWGIGGVAGGAVSYGPTDDQESKLSLRHALERGVTFYDTSDLYGYGHSETLIGSAFKDRRQEVLIASKVGKLKSNGQQDFSEEHIRRSIEGSLRRLQTDYIDLYQLHDPPVEGLENGDGPLGTLDSLKKEGKIRAFGISLRSPAEGLIAIEKLGVKCIQVNFNMVDQRAVENGLMDLCKRQGVGVICRTPLCFGFLTGRYSAQAEFYPGDHRGAWPPEQIALWSDAYRFFSSAISNQQQTPAQIALRFCLSYPGLSTVIPGMLTRQQVEEDALASPLGPFTETERRTIEKIYQENTFFLGKGKMVQPSRLGA